MYFRSKKLNPNSREKSTNNWRKSPFSDQVKSLSSLALLILWSNKTQRATETLSEQTNQNTLYVLYRGDITPLSYHSSPHSDSGHDTTKRRRFIIVRHPHSIQLTTNSIKFSASSGSHKHWRRRGYIDDVLMGELWWMISLHPSPKSPYSAANILFERNRIETTRLSLDFSPRKPNRLRISADHPRQRYAHDRWLHRNIEQMLSILTLDSIKLN